MALCSTIAALSVTAGLISMPTFLYLYEHHTLMNDWTTQPIIDIKLMDSTAGCASDYEPLFGRMWNGTRELCDQSNYN